MHLVIINKNFDEKTNMVFSATDHIQYSTKYKHEQVPDISTIQPS